MKEGEAQKSGREKDGSEEYERGRKGEREKKGEKKGGRERRERKGKGRIQNRTKYRLYRLREGVERREKR